MLARVSMSTKSIQWKFSCGATANWGSMGSETQLSPDLIKPKARAMLNTGVDNIMSNRHKHRFSVFQSPEDEKLNRVMQIIVRKFGGDTVAFFNSIRPDSESEKNESEQAKSRIAATFAKRS
jgi:hypothetical protein